MSAKYNKIITPVFRVSFPAVFTPEKNKQSGRLTYKVTALFEKSDEKLLLPMKEAVHAELVARFGIDQTKWPKGLKLPFKLGNEKYNKNPEAYPMYKDMITVNFTSNMQPGVRNASNTQDIVDPKEFYAGCYARASVIARYWRFDETHSEGVHFLLNNLQKVKEGEPFGGIHNPGDDFEPVPGAAAASANDYDPLNGIGG